MERVKSQTISLTFFRRMLVRDQLASNKETFLPNFLKNSKVLHA